MQWTDKECFEAIISRDRRFDGKFFVCVKTTGIYCRPVCPANKPLEKNCLFVSSAAAAESTGFRPCFRCRPEAAPGSPAWIGTRSTVSRALRLLTSGGGEIDALPDFAARLGIGDRHLRRLFRDQLGASPKALIQTERFRIARLMLAETSRPIAEVAFAAGFKSIRRFNDAVKTAFGTSPSGYRQKVQKQNIGQTKAQITSALKLSLGYRPPYRWPEMMSFLARRALSGMEAVSPETYQRTIRINGSCGILEVRARQKENRIEAIFHLDKAAALLEPVQRVHDLFDLEASPDEIGTLLSRDPFMAPMVKSRPGLRIPGCWDSFELSVRAVVGQQISVKGATTILERLVDKFGDRISDLGGPDLPSLDRLFPTPEILQAADLSGLGLTGRRVEILRELARGFAITPFFVHPAIPLKQSMERLLAIRGIGPWTAEYIALRSLRHPDAFPASDLGLLKAAETRDPKALEERSEAWRPWRAYAALYLWSRGNEHIKEEKTNDKR